MPPSAALAAPSPPRLADGVELLGEYQGSGCAEAPCLLRQPDGRMVEISPLLNLVAASIDGRRDLQAIAAGVAGRLGRGVSADNVAYLIDHKLRPLGVLAGGESERQAAPPPRRPLLGLSLRTAVLPKGVVRVLSSRLRPLFLPPVVVAVLAGLAAVDGWWLSGPGMGQGMHQILYQPALILVVSALMVASGFWHELGHATASRYGGAEPGVIGAGIYLLWPAFFNDLNDTYRLGRAGRLRADLGGVYFNALFVLGLAGGYALTGFRPLLVVIALQHLAILQQFLPFLRLDGYYVVSDLVGVPDLFGRVRPILASLAPGRRRGAGVDDLRPRVRAVVTGWVVVTIPLLAGAVVLLGLYLPRALAIGWQSARIQAQVLAAAVRLGAVDVGLVTALQLVMLAVPFVGLSGTALRLLARAGRRPLRSSAGLAAPLAPACGARSAVIPSNPGSGFPAPVTMLRTPQTPAPADRAAAVVLRPYGRPASPLPWSTAPPPPRPISWWRLRPPHGP